LQFPCMIKLRHVRTFELELALSMTTNTNVNQSSNTRFQAKLPIFCDQLA